MGLKFESDSRDNTQTEEIFDSQRFSEIGLRGANLLVHLAVCCNRFLVCLNSRVFANRSSSLPVAGCHWAHSFVSIMTFLNEQGVNKVKTELLLFLAVLILCNTVYAQHTVTGTVVDQQTRQPVVGASVVIKGTSTGTTTNDFGRFTLTSQTEINDIIISQLGYEKKEVRVTKSEQSLFIQLTPSPIMLSGVQVVGSNNLSSAQSIGRLTVHDLERSSGLSLENSINTIPGVFMQSRTPWGGARITIRGYYPSTGGNSPNFNGLGYQVFLNNVPITDATGSTVLDGVDFSTLGNVEVIKGPSSSLYGSFIGGTVNMTTIRPQPGQTSFNEQTIGGSYGLFRNNTTFESAGDNSDVVLNYGHQTYKSFRPHSASWKDYAFGTTEFQVGGNEQISAYFSYDRSFEELAGEIDGSDFYNRIPLSNPEYLSNSSHIKTQSFRAGITGNYRFDEDFSNKTTVFGSGVTSNQPYAHGFTDGNQFNYGVRTAFNYGNKGKYLGLSGTLGGMFQASNITTNGVFIIPRTSISKPSDFEEHALNYYLFTQWNLIFPEQVILTLGASLNRNEFGVRNMLVNGKLSDTTNLVVKTFSPVLTPQISLLKVLNNNISVYASVSTGYTPPLLSDVVATNGSLNLSVKPESAVQYEIGSKGSAFEKKMSYEIAVFDLENTNKLVSETSNSVTFTTNAGKQRNRGLELSLSYLVIDNKDQTLSILRPWLSYTYSDFRYVDFKSNANNNSTTVDFSGNQVARVPKNMLNAGIDLGTNIGWYLYGTYEYVGRTPVTFDNSTFVKAYNLLSAKLGYQDRIAEHFDLNFFIGGDNLLGSTYYTFLFVGPNITGLEQAKDGGTGDGYIIPGSYKATFYGSISLSYIF